MPIYDYACTHCGRIVEVVHGVHGGGPTTCETCGGPMKKLLSAPAVHFKGSGWAKKDRARSATKAAKSAGGDAAAKPAEAGATEAATSKPASPTPTATPSAGSTDPA